MGEVNEGTEGAEPRGCYCFEMQDPPVLKFKQSANTNRDTFGQPLKIGVASMTTWSTVILQRKVWFQSKKLKLIF